MALPQNLFCLRLHVHGELDQASSDQVPPGQAVFSISLRFQSSSVGSRCGKSLAMAGKQRTRWPFRRGLVGTCGMGLGFTGLGLLPLPEVTAIGYAAPLFVVVFAAMFLNEKVGVYRLSMVALGMIGVLIVLSPRLSLGTEMSTRETLGAVVVLMGAMFAALAHVFVRKLVQTEDTAAIVFGFRSPRPRWPFDPAMGLGVAHVGCRADANPCGAVWRSRSNSDDLQLPLR